jgi:hypothetical protein
MASIWEGLLSRGEEEVTLPWLGGESVHGAGGRRWSLRGGSPRREGWYRFAVEGGRRAALRGPGEADEEALAACRGVCGYLVGDRLIPDEARVEADHRAIIAQSVKVRLVEPGLERFARVRAARWWDGSWVYQRQELPLGPEGEVAEAWLLRAGSVAAIRGVTPALALAFAVEEEQRRGGEARRARLAALEAEERALEELIAEEAREQAEVEAQWQAEAAAARLRLRQPRQGRRRGAQEVEAAARAALALSGAELLDLRQGRAPGERVVQFLYKWEPFECVIEAESLRIVDAGICLVDHGTGERGDSYFTLESLPAVIAQAMREDRLVIFRRVR